MAADLSNLTIDVAEPDAWARRLTITVPAERVARERRDVTRRLASNITLPGFRKGKIPPRIVEQKYGPAIEQEVLQDVVEEAYREALEQQRFQPITQAQVEDIDYQPDTDLTFHVEFEIRPEIELDRVGGFRIPREQPDVGEEEVERVLERLQREHAVWQPLDDEAPDDGDQVEVEMTPLDDAGEPAADEPRSYELVLGEEQALPEVEEAIRGLQPGGERDLVVDLPPERVEEGEGGEHAVRVRLLVAKRADPPALDDEFAQSLGDFEDVEALRAAVREDLETEAGAEAERGVRQQLINQIIEANPFQVPNVMIEEYLDRLLQAPEDADPEQLAEARESARPAAERGIKRMMILARVAEQQGIEADADAVDERVERIAAQHDRAPGEVWSQLQQSGRLQELEEEIRNDRVFEYLESESTIE